MYQSVSSGKACCLILNVCCSHTVTIFCCDLCYFAADNLQLTNTLQKKLDEVRREKSLLEQRIDKEKKANAALQMELTGIRSNNLMKTAEKLEEEDEMEEED